MVGDHKASILLLAAGIAFLAAGLLNDPRQPLSFVAAGALMFAGFVRFWRSRRT